MTNFNLNLRCLASILKRAACLAAPVLGTACLTYHITKAMSGWDEHKGDSNREQEQYHGKSRNHGRSEQRSALKNRQGNINAGDVYNSTHIYHGCDANPLSSSSPTVGNNQPNGNESLSRKQREKVYDELNEFCLFFLRWFSMALGVCRQR